MIFNYLSGPCRFIGHDYFVSVMKVMRLEQVQLQHTFALPFLAITNKQESMRCNVPGVQLELLFKIPRPFTELTPTLSLLDVALVGAGVTLERDTDAVLHP